jgi:hypothetical protein
MGKIRPNLPASKEPHSVEEWIWERETWAWGGGSRGPGFTIFRGGTISPHVGPQGLSGVGALTRRHRFRRRASSWLANRQRAPLRGRYRCLAGGSFR